MCQKRRIVLVGKYPPPVGGVSVHVQRVARRLANLGHDVTVVDLESGLQASSLNRGFRRQARVVEHSFVRKAKLLFSLGVITRKACVHFHISSGRKFYWLSPFMLLLTSRASKRVITIHGGSWVKSAEGLSGIRVSLVRAVLHGFGTVICVNTQQSELILTKFGVPAATIPAYLPPVSEEIETLPGSLQDFLGSHETVLVTSGCRTPTYDYHTVFSALERVCANSRARVGLVVAAYGETASDYWDGVVRRARTCDPRVRIAEDLSPGRFYSLLGSARLYIRATLNDGDAVAIREAAAAGVQVVASDCVARPRWCATFPTGNIDMLATTIEAALADRELGREFQKSKHDENWAGLLEVYQE